MALLNDVESEGYKLLLTELYFLISLNCITVVRTNIF